MSQAVIPAIAGHGDGGSILNISSIAGKKGNANMAAYCTSNFGIQGFTQALAMELAGQNIRVNAVCPGIIDTSRMDDLGRESTWTKTIQQLIPLDRAGTDDEIGKFVSYLCTPEASYITGQSINMDGGVVMW